MLLQIKKREESKMNRRLKSKKILYSLNPQELRHLVVPQDGTMRTF
jgi:hypothetical protein